MISAVLLSLALTAAGWLATKIPMLRGPRLAWWELRPVSPVTDPAAAALAVASLRRGRRAGSVTLMREGGEAGATRQWIGIEGSADKQRSAAAIATSSGGVLGRHMDSPPGGPGRRWWYSCPVVPVDAEMIPESGIDEDSAGGFADYANAMLEPGDLLLVTARPNRLTPATVSAAAMTTCEAIAGGWYDNPSPAPKRPAPHPGFIGPAAGLLAGAAPFAGAALGVLQLPVVYALAGAACVAAAAGLVAAWRASPASKRAESGGSVPVPAETGKRLGANRKWRPAPVPSRLVAAWGGGGERTTVAAPDRYASEALTREDGAYIGADLAGRHCWLPDKDRQWGVFVLGDPGTGKTTMLLGLLAADCQAVSQGGTRRAQIWIETKGEGRGRAEKVMRDNGRDPLVIQADSMDENEPRLDMIDWGNPERSAKTLSEAMRYAFPDQAIMEESSEVLATIFAAAIAAPPDGLAQIGYPARPDLMELGFWMLDGAPEENRKEQVESALGKTPHYKQVYRYTKHMKSFDQARRLESSRNKLQALQAAKGLWAAGDRPEVALSTLIEDHHAVVLNFGPSGPSGAYSEMTAQRCAAMSMFFLWDTVKRICDGWQAQGRSVAIYCDELADIAGFGNPNLEVVRAMADQGRSRGVLPTFAAQRPGQIPERTREAVMSFGTRAYFRVDEVDTAVAASADLDEMYGVEEIRNMEIYRCAARVRRDGIAQPAFTLLPRDL